MAIAGKSAFLIGNTSSFMVDFPWVMLIYQKLALWNLQPFSCKTNKAREKMQIESTFNQLRAGRLRLWEKRYKQNIKNGLFQDVHKFQNFNVYNCMRNTKVYVYIKIYRETERERERVWVHVLFLQFTLYFICISTYLGIVLNCICIRMRYCIASWHAQHKYIFFHTRCECLRFRYTYFISDCICISVPWYVFFQYLLLNPLGGFEKSPRLVVKTVR